jgi:hypothetical protein
MCVVFVPTQQYFFAVFRGSTPPKMACVFAIYIYRTFVQTMTDKPDVKAAVYFDQLQRKVVVEIGVFEDDDDAKAACDFIINLLDLHKTSIPFEATVH